MHYLVLFIYLQRSCLGILQVYKPSEGSSVCPSPQHTRAWGRLRVQGQPPWRWSQNVECLSGMHEALGLVPRIIYNWSWWHMLNILALDAEVKWSILRPTWVTRDHHTLTHTHTLTLSLLSHSPRFWASFKDYMFKRLALKRKMLHHQYTKLQLHSRWDRGQSNFASLLIFETGPCYVT